MAWSPTCEARGGRPLTRESGSQASSSKDQVVVCVFGKTQQESSGPPSGQNLLTKTRKGQGLVQKQGVWFCIMRGPKAPQNRLIVYKVTMQTATLSSGGKHLPLWGVGGSWWVRKVAERKFPKFSNSRPESCPKFSLKILRSFRASFRGNGDQKKFTKNPRRLSMQNSQASSKRKSTKVLWTAGKVTLASSRSWEKIGKNGPKMDLPSQPKLLQKIITKTNV